MNRLKMKIEYDGTNFAGYQVQPNKRTVQSEFQEALKKLHKGKDIIITASGRTDAGVHATGQVIHFDTDLNIQTENWKRALNSLLPQDIRVRDVKAVAQDFHARFGAIGKQYRYFIDNSPEPTVFKRNTEVHIGQSLCLESMRKALKLIEGTHDFSAFCAANTSVKDKVRTIYRAELKQEGNQLIFIFEGNGFLYNMVRILVGTMLEIGMEKKEFKEIVTIINSKNRHYAGKTAPPQGLYLWKVYYNN